MAELEFIAWIRAQTEHAAGVAVGPGDDCAVLESAPHPWLITTDMLMEGIDFVVAEAGIRRVGRKAMSVNLSDIAAMGGRARFAVVSVSLPHPWSKVQAEELYLGMRERADAFGVSIVGGDTNAWDGPLVISVTALGEPGPHGPILRRGAQPGDWLFVTGPLGGSLAGHHLDFVPRLAEVATLQAHVKPKAMIDLSDGLAKDLRHLCAESGVGAVVCAERLPPRDIGVSLEAMLGDGEDFELLLAVSPEDGARLMQTPPIPLWHIGTCLGGRELLLEEQGVRRALPAGGFVHRFG